MKVLSFGSLNIDYVYTVSYFVKKGETLSAKKLNVYTGGKGLNQSIALSRAGLDTYMAGAVGTDGMFLLESLKEAGVNTSHVKILQEVRTGNAIILNPSPMNEKIMELPLDQIDYFLLNEIEAMQILQMEELKGINGKCIAGLLHEKFPNATIVLTLGGDISNHI